jgi:hypothetical protein
MAAHRRPLLEGPPPELLVFRGEDWISGDGCAAVGEVA